MFDKAKLISTFGKPVLTALFGSLATHVLYGSGTVSLFGIGVNSSLVLGGALLLADLFGETMHSYILPHIPHNEKFASMEGMALKPIFAGLGYDIALLGSGMADFEVGQLMRGFFIGGSSVLASEYAWDSFIAPELQPKGTALMRY